MTDPILPPADADAEMSVLGAILLGEAAANVVLDQVTEHDYSRNANRLIHRAITELHRTGGGVEEITVCDQLERTGDLEAAGGRAYIHGLADVVPIALALNREVAIVVELAKVRRALSLSADLAQRLHSRDTPVEDVLRDHAAAIDNLTAGHTETRRHLYSWSEALADWHASETQDASDGGIRTGVPTLDQQLGPPLHRSEVVMIAARTGVGKTWLQLDVIAAALQRRPEASALLASLEMTHAQIAHRMLAQRSGITMDHLRRQALVGDAQSAVELGRSVAPELDRLRILDASTSLDDLPRDIARARKLGHDVHIVAVDYLGLVKPRRGEKTSTVYERMSAVATGLKDLAKDEDVLILSAVQLSRDAIAEGKRPSVEKLRDSGAIEEAADRIIGLWDPAREHGLTVPDRMSLDGQIRCCILKNRHGSTGGPDITLHYTEGRSLRELDQRGHH